MTALALTSVLVESEAPSVCCGTDLCHHTVIRHGDHVGYLNNGQLLCRKQHGDRLEQCALEDINDEECKLVPLEDGHEHGPGCGHEQVPHGDHFDYIVGNRLHHVATTESCCRRRCIQSLKPSSIVDHGRVSVINSPKAGKEIDARTATTKIHAAGICCPAEVGIIHKLLETLPGVQSVEVTVVTKMVKVEHDPMATTPATLVATLNSARLEACLGERGVVTGQKRRLPPWHVLACGLLFVLSLVSYSSPVLKPMEYLALGAIALGSPPILIKAWAALRCKTVDINVLMVIAAAGAIGLADYAEAAAIVFIFGFAQWLEDRCMSRASTAVASMMALQPESALLAPDKIPVALDAVTVGSEIFVLPGEGVPLDGIILQGSSSLDESMLTGETRPVVKSVGAELMSGTINCGGGSLLVKVTSTSANSTVSRLARVMEEALKMKTHRDLLIEQVARVYTPLVVFTAFLLALVPSVVARDQWREWVYLALAVLVTGCPCALVLSTPVASVCALTRCTRQGVLVKGSRHLEAFAALKVVSFDKTGTLTEGRFAVVEFAVCTDKLPQKDLLAYVATLERHSTHPLAPAIIGYAAANGACMSKEVRDVVTLPGVGLRGQLEGHDVLVCNVKVARTKAKRQEDVDRVSTSATARMATACCIVVDDEFVGHLLLCDQLRADACQTIQQLTARGVTCRVLSGDDPNVVVKVGSALGFSRASLYGGLSPADKLARVQQWSSEGVLAHVGDGINDGPALAAAGVGVAMGVGGSALAIEAADVALYTNNLQTLVFLHDISRRLYRVVVCNIVFSIVTKVAMLVLIGLSIATLWLAVLADVGTSLLVVLNSLTLLHYKRDRMLWLRTKGLFVKEKQGKCCTSSCCSSGTEGVSLMGAGPHDPLSSVPNVSTQACAKHCCSRGPAGPSGAFLHQGAQRGSSHERGVGTSQDPCRCQDQDTTDGHDDHEGHYHSGCPAADPHHDHHDPHHHHHHHHHCRVVDPEVSVAAACHSHHHGQKVGGCSHHPGHRPTRGPFQLAKSGDHNAHGSCRSCNHDHQDHHGDSHVQVLGSSGLRGQDAPASGCCAGHHLKRCSIQRMKVDDHFAVHIHDEGAPQTHACVSGTTTHLASHAPGWRAPHHV